MGCKTLLNGLDLTCRNTSNKYYQSIILINRADVDDVLIKDNDSQHRISFNLHANKSGILFNGNSNSNLFTATFGKSTEKGIPLYNHSLELPVVGADETVKVLLKQLDNSDVFAAIQLTDGTVEIHGFQNGLTTGNYNYEPQSALGGAVIPLNSAYDEYVPPYVYYAKGNENEHFNTLFLNIGAILGGDFNQDFSNDFDNIIAV